MQATTSVPPATTATPSAGPPPVHWLHWGRPLALTTLACFIAGRVSLALAIAPGFAAPLALGAGIGLASVLVYGRRMLFGVGIGALLANSGLAPLHGHPALVALAAPALAAAAAALQAFVGAVLVHRFVSRPLTLTLPRDVAMFLLACLASSVVAPTLSAAFLLASSRLPAAQLGFTWLTWWVADLAGLLIATPIALTLIGRPNAEWAPRRMSVGLTMMVVVALLALGIVQAGRWNGERLRSNFNHDASGALLVLETQLQEPLRALEAMRGIFIVAGHPSPAEMRIATENWLGGGAVRAMGWIERVRRGDVAAFEARARADGSAGFRVFDRPDASPDPGAALVPSGGLESLAGNDDIMAVRHIEPKSTDGGGLGINAMSIPLSRVAMMTTVESGRPAATSAFPLAPRNAADKRLGVVLFQAVYERETTSAVDRQAALRGVVFVTLAVDDPIASVGGKVPSYLDLCIVDGDPRIGGQRLSGPLRCENQVGVFSQGRPLLFGDRPWDLRASARIDAVRGADDPSAWIFSAIAALSAALLCASLLITTGRTRRIESAVRERTAALGAEVRERGVAEQALHASEGRFRNILDNVPIGIVYTDVAGRIIQANPRFCELMGYGEPELAALAAQALTHPDDRAEEAGLTAQLVAGTIPMYRLDKRFLTQAGGTVSARASVSLLRDAANEPWRIVGVVEDITEPLRLAEAEHARENAEASNRAKSEFLSRMSHELRTPLNAMLGFAQLLEIDSRHPLAPAQRPWVAQIQQAGWHLLDMINDVLDLSRIESDNLRLQTTTLDLPELVKASIALVTADAARRGIRISEELAPGTSAVMGDATRVKQILTNLLSNAVKYNSDDGRVHVATRLAGAELVEISVTDTGLGMTVEQMDQLFRPFNRLGRERTSPAVQGTGIGLVISRRLAELMGGSIRVKSVPGEGSSFILRIPKAIDPDTVRSDLDEFGSMPSDYHRRIVRYVEDNETNVEVMRGILAQRPQVLLEVSIAGLDGLAAVRANLPHLILLDMHLPDISGLELLRHFKADPATSAVPVIAISADATAQQIDAALDAGALRYLTKPVNVTELLAAVDDLLDRMDTGFN